MFLHLYTQNTSTTSRQIFIIYKVVTKSACCTHTVRHFTDHLKDQTIWEEEDAVFRCRVEPEDSKVSWFVKDIPVKQGAKYTMSALGPERELAIHKAKKTDTGSVSASVGNFHSRALLTVKGFISCISHSI